MILLHGAGAHHATFLGHWTSYGMVPDWIAISIQAKANAAWQPGEEKRVLEVLNEIEGKYSIRRVFVGGFSRGAGFSFNVALKHPDRFAGVLCLAGNLWEPALATKGNANKVAIAIVHGDADKIIPLRHGEEAKARFDEAGYETFMKVVPGLAHTLDGPGTQEALAWLNTTGGQLESAADYIAFARERIGREKFGQAVWAIRAIGPDAPSKVQKEATSLLKKIENQSERVKKKLLKKIRADKNAEWVEAWNDYDRKYRGVEYHADVAGAVDKLRADHEKRATELAAKAREARQAGDTKAAIESCLEVRDRCYLATGDGAEAASRLLTEFREDPEIAKKYRRLLRQKNK